MTLLEQVHDECPVCKHARAEIERLRAALTFYADPFAWKKIHDPENDTRVPDFYEETSFGDMAVEALGETERTDG